MKARLKLIYIALWSLISRTMARGEKRSAVTLDSSLRIAFVKQSVYGDLYSKSGPGLSAADLIFSSRHRSGPVGLFTDLKTDFMIVNTSDDPSCQVFLEKQHWPNDWVELRRRTEQQASVAADVNKVDWGVYDLVLALECAIPPAITSRYPEVAWATMLEAHSQSSYKTYLKTPPPGYDFFFTQHFGPTPRGIGRRDHAVDWSYSVNRSGSVLRLFPTVEKRSLAVIETHQPFGAIVDALAAVGMDSHCATGDRIGNAI